MALSTQKIKMLRNSGYHCANLLVSQTLLPEKQPNESFKEKS